MNRRDFAGLAAALLVPRRGWAFRFEPHGRAAFEAHWNRLVASGQSFWVYSSSGLDHTWVDLDGTEYEWDGPWPHFFGNWKLETL